MGWNGFLMPKTMNSSSRFEFSADLTWREWGLALMFGRALPWSTSRFYIQFCLGPFSMYWALKRKAAW